MRQLTFLVVDAKMFVAAIKNVIVSRLGSEKVYTATNGEDAWALLQSKKIDIVIADWELKRLSGEALLEKVRNDDKLKDMPFVVMSTIGDKNFVVGAIQRGASQFMVKPFSPEKLDDTLRKAWNSATKRNARRYSGLPEHSLNIQLGEQTLTAQVQNISRSGLLLSMTYDQNINLFGQYQMAIEFDDIDDVGVIHIGPLPSKVVRMEAASSYHHSTLKCEIAVAFAVELFEQQCKENLTELFTFLKSKEA